MTNAGRRVSGPGNRSAEAYRGPDRRRQPPESARFPLRAVGLSLAALAAVAVLLTLTEARPTETVELLAEMGLLVLSVAAALLLAAMSWLAWQVDGRAAGAWLAAAASVLTLAMLVPRGLKDLAAVGWEGGLVQADVLMWLPPAGRLVVVVLLLIAALDREVSGWLRPAVAVALGLGATGVVVVIAQLVPDVLPRLASPVDAMAADDPTAAGSLVLTLAWAVVTGLLTVRARTRRDGLLLWFALLAGTLAIVEVLRTPGVVSVGHLSDDIVRTLGLGLTAGGVASTVLWRIAQQRGTLLEAQESSRAAHARLAHADAHAAELRHEARNALSSIALATGALKSYHDQLDPESRAELSSAIATEVERLGRMMERDRARTDHSVPLWEVLAPQCTASMAAGAEVHLDVPIDLTVRADPDALAQVVGNLLTNARRHAPGSPVRLRAVPKSDGVVLRCEDRGPGVPQEERQRIFRRGVRGSTGAGDGDGLGLHVAARLMREQGGAIWVEPRAGGGASFAVWLPADSAAANRGQATNGARSGAAGGVDDPLDQRDEVIEVTDGPSARAPAPLDHGDTVGQGEVRHADEHVGTDVDGGVGGGQHDRERPRRPRYGPSLHAGTVEGAEAPRLQRPGHHVGEHGRGEPH